MFDLLNPDLPKADGYVIPSISWSTRILTMMYGMAFLQSNYDTAFMQKGHIRLAGSAEDYDVADEFEKVTVHNPSSGRVYVAHRRIDGTGGPWYGAELLLEVKDVVDQYEEIMADEKAAAEEEGRDVEEPDEAVNLRFDFEDKFLDIELLRQLYEVNSIAL